MALLSETASLVALVHVITAPALVRRLWDRAKLWCTTVDTPGSHIQFLKNRPGRHRSYKLLSIALSNCSPWLASAVPRWALNALSTQPPCQSSLPFMRQQCRAFFPYCFKDGAPLLLLHGCRCWSGLLSAPNSPGADLPVRRGAVHEVMFSR